ncbi:MAG: RsmD family RNA methyltransferase, partial [Miltoncostaeaceae bacterium]
MRVIAGSLGGRRLVAPPGRGTRPTSDRVKEALFSIIGPLEGVAVLDLFAGSGALAIEALSRGAASAVCVDDERGAADAIRANARVLGLEGRLRVER